MNSHKDIRVQEHKYPLYIIVKEKLYKLIEQGYYKPGEKLPRETKLAEMLNVSRNTLREALRLAQMEGWITQQQGVGTFASSRVVIEQGLEILESIDSMGKRKHWVIGTKKLKIVIIPASKGVACALEIEENTPVISVSRIKTSDGQCIAYVEDFIPVGLVSIEEIQLRFTGSVLDFFIKRNRPQINYARTNITAIHPGQELSEMLSVPQSTIIFLAEETLFTHENIPIEYSLNYMLISFFRFHIVRKIPGAP